MLIRFSTAYNKKTNCDNLQGNVRLMGENGLLELLERELGLYDFYPNEYNRLKEYRVILNDHKVDSFFQDAFERDPFTVTEALLKYRDNLVLLGWRYEMKTQPLRLYKLAQIEKEFIKSKSHIGEADRWQLILKNIHHFENSNPPFQIQVDDNLEDLPQYLKTILEALNVKEVNSSHDMKVNNNLQRIIHLMHKDQKDETLTFDQQDSSIKIYKFNNRSFMEEVCAFSTNENDLVILKDAAFFDMSLVSLDKAASGSDQNQANPPVVQFFNLISNLINPTPNLDSLITFLQIQDHPFPFRFRNKLLQCLKELPGLNNVKWKNIVDEFIEDSQEEYSKYSDKVRKELVESFLSFHRNEGLVYKRCHKMLDYLLKWSNKRMHSIIEPTLSEQFSKLIELCKEAGNLMDENMNTDDIHKLFKYLYNSSNYTNYTKQQKSLLRLDSLSQIADPTEEKVYWLDCKADETISYPLSFLLEEEVAYLKDHELDLYSLSSFVNLQYQQELRGLLNIEGSLKLVMLEGEEMHPLLLKIESLLPKGVLDSVSMKVESLDDWIEYEKIQSTNKLNEFSQIQLPEPKDYMELENIKNIKRREVESASSLERFVHYPFDWVMERSAKLNVTRQFDMPNEFLHNGNIAHKVIEILLEKQKLAKDIVINSEVEIKKVLDQVILEQGIHYLSPENKPKLASFSVKLNRSIQSLQEFIKLNKLSIIECEKQFGANGDQCSIEETSGKVTGYIDLILKDEQNNTVILDLKWTRSEKKYKELIENDEAIQLAIYAAAMDIRSTAKTGYYLLNQNKLITNSEFRGSNIEVVHPEFNIDEVLFKLKRTINFRFQELAEGRLEIAEDTRLDELEISKCTDVILPNNSAKSKRKKANPYTGYDLFKGLIQ